MAALSLFLKLALQGCRHFLKLFDAFFGIRALAGVCFTHLFDKFQELRAMFVEKVFAVVLSISFGFVLLHVLGNANVSTHHLKNGNTNKIMRNRESLFGNF